MNKIFITLAVIALSGMISCKRKGCTDPTALNYDEKAKKDDNTCTYPKKEKYTVPSTYAFTDANGVSTVDISGQFQRLDMLGEIVTYLKSANTAGVGLSAQQLKDMYANNGYAWTDANQLGMTGSSKQLKSKTALGDAGIQAYFEALMDSVAVLSNTTVSGVQSGQPGVGGVWPNDGVKGPYLMSATGVEYTQLIAKGLMAAVFSNQMTLNYLKDLDADDNTTPEAGKNYTAMEHHWDEAYGYFTNAVDFPTSGTDRFWGEYAFSREAVLGSATKIAAAFRKGRAAISNKDYSVRDAQVVIIIAEMEKVASGAAIHYLKEAKIYITNSTAKNHYLSEAYAFIDGLRYGAACVEGTGASTAQIDAVLAYLSNFNNVTLADLDNAINTLASATGLTSYKDQL